MKRPQTKEHKTSTSWEPASQWYKSIVGDEGHYYHQRIVLPGVLRLLNFSPKTPSALLDLACGSGVLARHVPDKIEYVGVDLSSSLIKEAKKLDRNPLHTYFVSDVMKSLPIDSKLFTHATIILALQNIQSPLNVFQNASKFLGSRGKLVIVLNHPCFRIPRQSSWAVDDHKKIQYRRIDRYLSPLEIPIQAHPSKGEKSPALLSYHYPLSSYFQWLNEAGFAVNTLEEWCSDKVSTGAHAKMENRSREEIPLFMALTAHKLNP